MVRECESSLKHNEVERKVIKNLENKGFTIIDNSYHHNLNDKEQEVLKKCNNITALSKRVEPDYLVVNSEKCFYLELKSGQVRENKICIEAFPLLYSKLKSSLVNIYYGIYTDNKLYIKNVNKINLPEKVIVPNLEKNKVILPILEKYFKTKIIDWKYDQNEKSGDAFIELDITDWKYIICE